MMYNLQRKLLLLALQERLTQSRLQENVLWWWLPMLNLLKTGSVVKSDTFKAGEFADQQIQRLQADLYMATSDTTFTFATAVVTATLKQLMSGSGEGLYLNAPAISEKPAEACSKA